MSDSIPSSLLLPKPHFFRETMTNDPQEISSLQHVKQTLNDAMAPINSLIHTGSISSQSSVMEHDRIPPHFEANRMLPARHTTHVSSDYAQPPDATIPFNQCGRTNLENGIIQQSNIVPLQPTPLPGLHSDHREVAQTHSVSAVSNTHVPTQTGCAPATNWENNSGDVTTNTDVNR